MSTLVDGLRALQARRAGLLTELAGIDQEFAEARAFIASTDFAPPTPPVPAKPIADLERQIREVAQEAADEQTDVRVTDEPPAAIARDTIARIEAPAFPAPPEGQGHKRDRAILDYLRDYGARTTLEISSRIRETMGITKHHLDNLRETGKVTSSGATAGMRWMLPNSAATDQRNPAIRAPRPAVSLAPSSDMESSIQLARDRSAVNGHTLQNEEFSNDRTNWGARCRTCLRRALAEKVDGRWLISGKATEEPCRPLKPGATTLA